MLVLCNRRCTRESPNSSLGNCLLGPSCLTRAVANEHIFPRYLGKKAWHHPIIAYIEYRMSQQTMELYSKVVKVNEHSKIPGKPMGGMDLVSVQHSVHVGLSSSNQVH